MSKHASHIESFISPGEVQAVINACLCQKIFQNKSKEGLPSFDVRYDSSSSLRKIQISYYVAKFE